MSDTQSILLNKKTYIKLKKLADQNETTVNEEIGNVITENYDDIDESLLEEIDVMPRKDKVFLVLPQDIYDLFEEEDIADEFNSLLDEYITESLDEESEDEEDEEESEDEDEEEDDESEDEEEEEEEDEESEDEEEEDDESEDEEEDEEPKSKKKTKKEKGFFDSITDAVGDAVGDFVTDLISGDDDEKGHKKKKH